MSKQGKREIYQQPMALEEKKLNADIKSTKAMQKNSEAMHALLMKFADKMDKQSRTHKCNSLN